MESLFTTLRRFSKAVLALSIGCRPFQSTSPCSSRLRRSFRNVHIHSFLLPIAFGALSRQGTEVGAADIFNSLVALTALTAEDYEVFLRVGGIWTAVLFRGSCLFYGYGWYLDCGSFSRQLIVLWLRVHRLLGQGHLHVHKGP